VGEDPFNINWEDFSIGQPVIIDEHLWIDIVAIYSPHPDDQDPVIVWEHSPGDTGWDNQLTMSPYHIRFSPSVAGEHTITGRYYAEGEGCEIGCVQDTVTFTVLEKPAIDLLSDVPKDTLLIGERMPLFATLVEMDPQGQYEAMSIDPTVEWVITNVEGSGTVAKASHWRELWPGEIPSEPGHSEWWFTGTLAGASEGKVKVTPVLVYLTPGYPTPQINVLTGPEHEIEVRGFVDLRLDDVGEWGEEDPGAFMAKGGIEDLTQRFRRIVTGQAREPYRWGI